MIDACAACACVKLIAQVESCLGKTASMYIRRYACMVVQRGLQTQANLCYDLSAIYVVSESK